MKLFNYENYIKFKKSFSKNWNKVYLFFIVLKLLQKCYYIFLQKFKLKNLNFTNSLI